MLDYRIHFARLLAEERLRERLAHPDRPDRPSGSGRRIFRLGARMPARRRGG